MSRKCQKLLQFVSYRKLELRRQPGLNQVLPGNAPQSWSLPINSNASYLQDPLDFGVEQ